MVPYDGGMTSRRSAAVAGSWYPDAPARLAADVDRYLAGAEVDPIPSHIRAVVVPHAGLMYSGPVAAFAYKLIRDTAYGAVVLVGPSHFVRFEGVSIWPSGAWQTPFGDVQVDADLAAAIASESPVVLEHAAAHGREHSLEMQMPFIAHLMPGVPIVPLVMGHQTRATAEALGDALARAVAARTPAQMREQRPSGHPSNAGNAAEPTEPRRGEVLLLASSDLSHYENAAVAARLDAVVVDRVGRLDPEGLMEVLEREPRHACGGGPMVSVLRASRQLGATRAKVLDYADSGDVSGDKSSVVGYMAAAVW
jgi:predicted class III extradiol MEMO1 family dioxygenase